MEKDYRRDYPKHILLTIKTCDVFEKHLKEQLSQIMLSQFGVIGVPKTPKMILIVYESVLNDYNLDLLRNFHTSIELIVVCGNERSVEYLLYGLCI